MTEPEVSVVVPLFNEADNVEPLTDRLQNTLSLTGMQYEVIYVDDASTDSTEDVLRQVCQNNAQVRSLRHTANLGQSAALLTGFQSARGRIVITMDGDLQNDPDDIPALMHELDGCDAVCGWRYKRKDTLVKKLCSRVANRIRAVVLGDGMHDAGCTFRAMRAETLVQLPAFRGLHRFLPFIWKVHGFRVHEIPIRHLPRLRGVSKYGIGNRLFVGLFDMAGMLWYRSRHISIKRVAAGDNLPTSHTLS